MEVPFSRGGSCRWIYLCALLPFIYLAFFSSCASAAPFFTSDAFRQKGNSDDRELTEALDREDIRQMCARSDTTLATKVLCRLVRLKAQAASEPDVLPMRRIRMQRLRRRESSSFSTFQKTVDVIRKLAEDHADYRRVYNKLVHAGLVSSSGNVIDLPTDSSLQSKMRAIG